MAPILHQSSLGSAVYQRRETAYFFSDFPDTFKRDREG